MDPAPIPTSPDPAGGLIATDRPGLAQVLAEMAGTGEGAHKRAGMMGQHALEQVARNESVLAACAAVKRASACSWGGTQTD